MRQLLRTLPLLAAVLAVLAPGRAGAAPEGLYGWLSPLAGIAAYSDRLHYPAQPLTLKNSPIFGLRLGHSLGGGFGLEAAGAYSKAKTEGALGEGPDVTVIYASGSIVYTPIVWALGGPYLAAGGGYVKYKSDAVSDDLHYGTFEQAVGWNAWMGQHAAFRFEARNVLDVPNKDYGRARLADQQLWAGLTFAWGGRPKDSDADGVPDKLDKCPGTPAGAHVDANGCPTDADGDGVFDGLDQCPNTPTGATVDAKGCPSDADGDGVFDGIDKCPNTPKGAKVDATGCPLDSDGDGVYDGLDQCPNTPKGAVVDEKGCPKDSDGDGVPDGLDKCADTPAGAKVDVDGCPIVVTEKETELLDTGMIRLQNVNFETGKAELLPESYTALDEVGAILRKWPQLKIEIGGHTDSRGLPKKNQVLSEARAQAVKDYLVKKYPDLANEQLTVKGYGATRPIAPNRGALNLAKNRRVEFVVLNKDVLKKEVERRKTLQK